MDARADVLIAQNQIAARERDVATPVTDLRHRLRNAGVTEEQADAIVGAVEVLSNQIGDLWVWQRVHTALLVLILAAVLAPYL
jgi:hypothetical protein